MAQLLVAKWGVTQCHTHMMLDETLLALPYDLQEQRRGHPWRFKFASGDAKMLYVCENLNPKTLKPLEHTRRYIPAYLQSCALCIPLTRFLAGSS